MAGEDLVLPVGYKLVEACKLVQYKITGTAVLDGQEVPRVREIWEGAWYLVGQSTRFAQAFNQALLSSRTDTPDGYLVNPVCQEIITCVTRACGY